MALHWPRFMLHIVIVNLLLLALPASALEIDGLYIATVEIASRDDESTREKAFSTALSEVIIKVSGRAEAVDAGSIAFAIKNPEAYVESWVYRTLAVSDTNSNDEDSDVNSALILQVNFYQAEINRLLDDSNIPLWPANRQETLVWVVTQNELEEKQVLASAELDDSEIGKILTDVSQVRGVPTLLPLMDLEDQFAITADEVWEFNVEALIAASQRYQTESILVLRVYRSLSGELLTRSVYIFRDRALPHQSYDEGLLAFVSSSFNLVSEELAAYYAVLLSNTDSSSITVNLQVAGVNDIQSYAGLLAYLDNLAAVSHYQIVKIDQQHITLSLATGGQFRQLVEAFALDNKLELVNDLRRTSDENVLLSYLWLGKS